MAISAGLIKRIEAAEKKAVLKKIPDLVWLRYSWEKRKFAAVEQYFSNPGKGSKNRVQYFDHYRDYIIPADFEGTVILDLMDCPEEFQSDMYSISAGDLKRDLKANGCGISMEYAGAISDKESKFDITILSYAK